MKKSHFKIIALSLIFALSDQLSKYYVEQNLDHTYNIFGNALRFEFVKNYWIAFGIKIPFYALIVLTIATIIAAFFIASKELKIEKKLSQFVVALVIGGALGNLTDRFTRGFVIDFIGVLSWPNFNLADIYISLGVLLIIAFYAKIRR